ncbi:hypothetical protein [Paraburkholderia sp. GAS334]|jgi:putative oxidoreductase
MNRLSAPAAALLFLRVAASVLVLLVHGRMRPGYGRPELRMRSEPCHI